MTVPQLLATHTSQELAEWLAYDRVYGVGDRWMVDTLANIHEVIQFTNHLIGAAFLTEEDEENPIPAPARYPRPGEWREVEE